MTLRRMRQPCTAAVLLALTISASAIMFETYPVQLAKADRNQIEVVACRQPHGVLAQSVKAYTYSRKRPLNVEVDVQCQSHGKVEGHTARFDTSCNNAKGRWMCKPPALVASVPIGVGTVDLQASDVTWPVAIAVVRDVSAARYMLGEDLVAGLQEGTCWVQPNVPDAWSVRCGLLEVTVIRPCTKSCPYEVISASRAIP